MTDIERAREIAAPYVKYDPEETLLGWWDGEGAVHSALAAIQAERERAKVVVNALQWVRKNNGPNTVGVVNEALAKWEAGNV